MTNIYSLLNYITATSKDQREGSLNSPHLPYNVSIHSMDESTMRSVNSTLQEMSEDQKRLIGISVISVVTRLALEFHNDEVCISFSD